MGLFITLILGAFVLAGAAIAACAKNGQRIVELSVAVALGAVCALLCADLLPEVVEAAEEIGWPMAVVGAFAGLAALWLLDRFLPEAPGDGFEAHEGNSALHISAACTVALSVHNVIEGMSVYSAATQSLSMGLLLAFGIGIHNVPMGMIVCAGVRGQSRVRQVLVVGAAALSTFAGGLVMFVAGSATNEAVVAFMLTLTVGLLAYIVAFELVPHVVRSGNWALSAAGIAAGACVVLAGVFIAGLA